MNRLICLVRGHLWSAWWREEDFLNGTPFDFRKCERCPAYQSHAIAGAR